MEEKKHIDRYFQEKFKDYEVYPEPHIWENIEQQLTKKKRKRIVPLWLRIGGAAAILLLLVNGGFWFFNQKESLPKIENSPVLIDKESHTEPKEGSNQIITNKDEPSSKPIKEKSQKEATKNNYTKPLKNTEAVVVAKKNNETDPLKSNEKIATTIKTNKNDIIAEKNLAPKNSTKEKKQDLITKEVLEKTKVAVTDIKKNITVEIEENLKNSEENAENILDSRWSVGPTMAPVFFNTLSNGSPISAALSNSKKVSSTSLAYGVKVNYNINKRFSLQTGIHAVELAYKTKDVRVIPSSDELLVSNFNTTNILFVSATEDNNLLNSSSELTPQNTTIGIVGDLNQSMSYVEIPTEIKYAITTKTRLGINAVGGISTYILYNKKLIHVNNTSVKNYQTPRNINTVNFSGNLGLGIDYKINKKLFINVTPMFKYQFNTFSENDGGFKPYYFGVYTGLNFRF